MTSRVYILSSETKDIGELVGSEGFAQVLSDAKHH